MATEVDPLDRAETAFLDRSKGRKLHYQIADYIRDKILSGDYRPGQKLAVEHVAAALGVSSMPVREAMVSLANEGMLVGLPRRGFAVGNLRKTDIEDVITVHAFIAGAFAERAAAVISEDDIELLRNLQHQIVETVHEGRDREHRARVGDLNFEFHKTVNKAVGLRRLGWFLRAVTRYVPRHVYETVDGWDEISIHEHPGIVEALERRDGALARALTEAHVRSTGASLVRHLEERGFWDGASAKRSPKARETKNQTAEATE